MPSASRGPLSVRRLGVEALGGLTAAIVLLAGLPPARADELAELRANQERLQQRLDQLAQDEPAGAPVRPSTAIGVGSFPRSLLIPGTDTSLRIGGQAVGSVLWYLKGAATGGALGGTGSFGGNSTEGQGSTANLSGIPLKGVAAATAVGFAPSRSSEWIFSGKQSRIFLDVRQPSAWGEIQAFVGFDFGTPTPNATLNDNQGSFNGHIMRFRVGYATFGGLLMGQTTGTSLDVDSLPELVDAASQTGINFPARTPQVRYTYPLPGGMSIAVAAENPDPSFAGPFGGYFTDTNQIPTAGACTALTSPTVGAAGTAAVAGSAIANDITNACLGNGAFFNPSQQLMPTFVMRGRVDQPWGHLQVSLSTLGYTLNDGRFLNRSYIGYGGSISGHFFTWGKDNIGGGIAGGDGFGDQIANGVGVATNFGGALNGQAVNASSSTSNFSVNRALYDSAVQASTIVEFSARLYYTHWWTDQLRSTADFSMSHYDIPAFIQASGRGANNKELSLTHLNLIWSPVAFVDLGVEGAWGHRVVVSNLRGDAYTVQTEMKVRF
jgi:hypothetical protein